jgi:epoxide hydrolase-like predicted phosphatase
MTIKAIISDFGGVLYIPPDTRWLRRWQFLLGLGRDNVISTAVFSPDESEYVRKVFTGEIPERELWRAVGSRWHVSPWLLERVRRSGFSKKRYNRPMAGFLDGLRPRYKTAILSNAGDQGRQIFDQAYNIQQLVDLVIISAEEHCAKPDERIYALTLERLGVAPGEALFIDDLPVNVEAARRLGIPSVLFQNTPQAISEIRRLLE